MSVATRTHRPPSRPRRSQPPRCAEPTTAPIRAVVTEPDPLYRAGITHVLSAAGVDVVASASNAEDAARKARAHHPDVVVADCLDTACEIHSTDPDTAVLVLSESDDERDALDVLGDRPEGFGFLLKGHLADVEDFTASVRRVARGGVAIDPVLVARLTGRGRAHDPVDDLTNRERQVLELMAEGHSNGCIADELVVTVAAVERHISGIFVKLDLPPNRADHRRVLAVRCYLGC
jgi:DNA-binding NarL/FixJ family response regulator